MESKSFPILNTERLILRVFEISDASEVQSLAGSPQIAATTATIPHIQTLEKS